MSPFDSFHFLDLTHPLDENVPTWTGRCGFRLEIRLDYEQGLRVQSIKTHAGVGTHMDAPNHFIPGSKNIADISLDDLIVPAYVFKMTQVDPDDFISASEIEDYEKKWGRIPEKSLFIASTGWEKYWKDSRRYRNPDDQEKMHFPGYSAEAAELLLERKISGIGIDTLSPDGSNHQTFPVHEKVLGAGKYILENLAQLDKMPSTGAYVIALPPKIKEATESACRVVGLIPNNK